MLRRRRVSCLLGLCIAWLLAAPAAIVRGEEAASGPPPEARKAFADGKAAFERGDYEIALQLFQRAALIAPAPSLYYNIGMAYERLGRYQDSAIAFEKYLELADAPQGDEERNFQTNLRARAAANRARARRSPNDPLGNPPRPLIEPPPAPPPNQPPAPQARVEYAPQPYGAYAAPRYVFTAPPLTHQQKLEKATRHRNNGIALTVIGGVFTVAGIGATIWAATTDRLGWTSAERGLVIWGTVSPIVIGVPLLIPGAVAWGKWQGELDKERKRPDDGAAAQKAALDLAAPASSPAATLLSGGLGSRGFVLSTPAVSF